MKPQIKLSLFLWRGLAWGALSGLVVGATSAVLVLTIFYFVLSSAALGVSAGWAALGILLYTFGLLLISPLYGMGIGLLGGGLFWNFTRQFSLANQEPDM